MGDGDESEMFSNEYSTNFQRASITRIPSMTSEQKCDVGLLTLTTPLSVQMVYVVFVQLRYINRAIPGTIFDVSQAQ